MNVLKSTSSDDSARSIVVAFDSKWLDPLLASEVGVVFRKKGPLKKNKVDYLYAYVSLPTGAIVGRAKIKTYTVMDRSEALRLASRGKIEERELRDYLGYTPTVSVFHLGKFEEAPKHVSSSTLREKYGCIPPQRFFFMSDEGKDKLDLALGLSRSPAKT